MIDPDFEVEFEAIQRKVAEKMDKSKCLSYSSPNHDEISNANHADPSVINQRQFDNHEFESTDKYLQKTSRTFEDHSELDGIDLADLLPLQDRNNNKFDVANSVDNLANFVGVVVDDLAESDNLNHGSASNYLQFNYDQGYNLANPVVRPGQRASLNQQFERTEQVNDSSGSTTPSVDSLETEDISPPPPNVFVLPVDSSPGNDNKVCKVCGDKAKGILYGVPSCEGCKRFFYVCMKSGKIYQCSKQQCCEVRKDTRNSCRYCRLQKCLDVGMRTTDFLTNNVPGPRRDCMVCGDKAAGTHYGVFSCRACEAFFYKRMKNEKKYKCSKQQCCEIRIDTRNRCFYCRLQKCLHVGMKKKNMEKNNSNRDGVVGNQLQANNDNEYDMENPVAKPEQNETFNQQHTSQQQPIYDSSATSSETGGAKIKQLHNPELHRSCVICGTRAVGLNFGVLSCEGCRRFFARNAGKIFYCPENQQCEYLRNNRNSCSYCRMQKCLDAGMKKRSGHDQTVMETGSSLFSMDSCPENRGPNDGRMIPDFQTGLSSSSMDSYSTSPYNVNNFRMVNNFGTGSSSSEILPTLSTNYAPYYS